MQKQIADDNRPRIEIEFMLMNRSFYALRLVNHGRHTAYKTKIKLSQAFIDSLPNDKFRWLLELEKDKECLIGVNQHYDLYLGNVQLKETANLQPLAGTITYEWNGSNYTEDIYVDVARQMTFFTVDDESKEIINEYKKNNIELKRIVYELEKIQNALEKKDTQDSRIKKKGMRRKLNESLGEMLIRCIHHL